MNQKLHIRRKMTQVLRLLYVTEFYEWKTSEAFSPPSVWSTEIYLNDHENQKIYFCSTTNVLRYQNRTI